MKHTFVIPIMLILLIGIACSLTGTPEPLADEGRIATSVAETVAAQTSQEIASTNTPAPATSTPLPPEPPTPTQSPTVLPTATQVPTVSPTATTAVTETPAALAVGDTILFEPYAVTLVGANVGDSFESRHWIEEDGSRERTQAREGYTLVSFDIEYVVTKFDPGTITLLYSAVAKDKDGDTYNCRHADSDLTYTVEPGYGGYSQMYCEAPLTAISSLDHVQLELKLTLQGNPHKDAKYTFELDKQSQNSAQVSVEKEREKHFPMDQPFTITCGTQYHVEYVFANPRWSDLDENRYRFERFSVDLDMTNPGKTNARQIMFRHGLFFDGIGYAAGITYVPPEDNIRDFPIPGGTGRYRLNFTLPPTEVVPLIAHWPQPNFEKGCEIKIGDYIISDNHDYFVYEIQTTGG